MREYTVCEGQKQPNGDSKKRLFMAKPCHRMRACHPPDLFFRIPKKSDKQVIFGRSAVYLPCLVFMIRGTAGFPESIPAEAAAGKTAGFRCFFGLIMHNKSFRYQALNEKSAANIPVKFFCPKLSAPYAETNLLLPSFSFCRI